jgi:bacterioferritin (cytochrome b1)
MMYPTAAVDASEALDALNRLLPALNRSLAVYLSYAPPWTPPGCESLHEAVARVAADHLWYCERLVETVRALRGTPQFGEFPSRYGDLHDLAINYSARQLVAELRGNLPLIEDCVAATAGVAPARELAEEILGNTRGHLELLEKLLPVGYASA